MNIEKAISVEAIKNSSSLPKGVSILVVDSDSTCLTIISKMLYVFGYKVVTAKRATDALSVAREKEDDLHLVLTEAHLPDMDKYEFLERMGEMSKLPIVIMSADDNENTMLGSLFKGAVFYLVKPITLNNIKNLWQFACMKNRECTTASDGVSSVQGGSSQENASDEDTESQSFENKRQSHLKGKRKEREEMEKDEEEDNDDSTLLKKPKLIWTNELHNRFLQAIRVLGVDRAHPKKILQHMNVPGIKKENISSHLQKYRLSLKREQDAIQKTVTRDSTGSSLASYCPSSTFSLQGLLQFSNQQSATTSNQPEFGSHLEKNLSSHMSMPFLGSAHFPSHVDSSCNDILNSMYEQLTPPSNQLDSSYPNSSHVGIGITSNELAGFGQMGNFNSEEIPMENMDLSNVDIFGFGNTAHCLTLLSGSIQQQHQQFLQPPPSPLPPPPQPPQEQEEHDIFGIERGEIDELFDIAKGGPNQLFHDEDFDDLW